MQAIQCPRCGMINQSDDVGYPRCGQCQEDLVRCDSCRHHEGTGCTHPRAYAQYTPDQEAAKQCREFRSRYAAPRPRMTWSIPAPLWVGGLLLFLILGLAGAALFIDPAARYFRGNPMDLRVYVDSQQTFAVDQPFLVTMQITNQFDQASTKYYVEVDEQNFRAETPVPEPDRLIRTPERLLLEYNPLPPGGRMILQIPFVPRQSGRPQFVAKLYAPSNHLRKEFRAQIEVVR